MRTFMSSSAGSLAAAARPRQEERLGDRVRLADEALEGPVAALLDARRDPGERRQRAERAAAAGELEGGDVVLRAVVVGGQRRRAQQVDRAVRADQAAAGEGRRGRQRDDEERRAPRAAPARLIERIIVDLPLDGRSVRTGPCWGPKTPRGAALVPAAARGPGRVD